ncbi:Gfo/Idh/MocA family protein [Flagellimonas sp.]|uniref:Gfo/Idh/MocA family protein n=1 Tax=Flagellimonas sp. TaxID=2058762 RepID=UPI003BAE1E63
MFKRRGFVKSVSMFGLSLCLPKAIGISELKESRKKIVGVVGLDTSHSPTLIRVINSSDHFEVTTAFTTVSMDFPLSANRVDRFTREVKGMGVEVVLTLKELLDKVDYVLLCTVDPRLHLSQAKEILRSGKRVFIDKPMAASLKEVVKIFRVSKKFNVPTFTSSALRFMQSAVKIRNGDFGKVIGADVYSPISYQPIFPELYWYGIHGIELLFTVMKPGCLRVKRFNTTKYDIITGVWADGRVGNFRGLKTGKAKFGGQVFTEKGLFRMDDYQGVEPLRHAVLDYFETGKVAVGSQETIEIFAFMEAAHESSKRNGEWVLIDEILDKVGLVH